MKIGTLELVVIAIVALLVIGPSKLPEYARKLGQAMREFKKASDSLTKEIKENIDDLFEEGLGEVYEELFSGEFKPYGWDLDDENTIQEFERVLEENYSC